MSKKWHLTELWSRSKPKQRTTRGQRGQPEDRRQVLGCFPKTQAATSLSIEEEKFKMPCDSIIRFSSFSNASTSSAPLGDHNDTFCSIMEAPLVARLSAIFNFVPAHGRKQTGWKYWCVTALQDSAQKSFQHCLKAGELYFYSSSHYQKAVFSQATLT